MKLRYELKNLLATNENNKNAIKIIELIKKHPELTQAKSYKLSPLKIMIDLFDESKLNLEQFKNYLPLMGEEGKLCQEAINFLEEKRPGWDIEANLDVLTIALQSKKNVSETAFLMILGWKDQNSFFHALPKELVQCVLISNLFETSKKQAFNQMTFFNKDKTLIYKNWEIECVWLPKLLGKGFNLASELLIRSLITAGSLVDISRLTNYQFFKGEEQNRLVEEIGFHV